MIVCKRVHYSGRVQGVGFRFTAQRLAQQRPITGFVKNLLDGKVELVVEGLEHHVRTYLDDLARAMAKNIEDVSIRDETPQNFRDFSIQH